MKAADAKLDIKGAAMASDAFFPFRDGIDIAAEYGITAVVQPGGSLRDPEVITAADEHGMRAVRSSVLPLPRSSFSRLFGKSGVRFSNRTLWRELSGESKLISPTFKSAK